MKLTLPLTALVALLGLALANAPVQAQATAPAATTPAAAPAKAAKKVPYSGTLSAIDTTANTVTVTSSAKTLVLSVTATTKISRDGKKAALADFKTGEKVTGSYQTDASGATTAASLNFGAGKKKAAKTASTPAPAATPATPAAQ